MNWYFIQSRRSFFFYVPKTRLKCLNFKNCLLFFNIKKNLRNKILAYNLVYRTEKKMERQKEALLLFIKMLIVKVLYFCGMKYHVILTCKSIALSCNDAKTRDLSLHVIYYRSRWPTKVAGPWSWQRSKQNYWKFIKYWFTSKYYKSFRTREWFFSVLWYNFITHSNKFYRKEFFQATKVRWWLLNGWYVLIFYLLILIDYLDDWLLD